MNLKKNAFITASILAASFHANADIAVTANAKMNNPQVSFKGGDIEFNASITNNNDNNANLRIYEYFIFPDGEIYNGKSRGNLKLTSGTSETFNNITFRVPKQFPLGSYQYVYSTFNKITGKIHSEKFNFYKQPKPNILYRTCNDILQAGASVGNGYYLIDPDGIAGVEAFEVYCDMTNFEGGWTLFANHQNDVFNFPSISNVTVDDFNVLDADKWQALIANMSSGLMTIDENNTKTLIRLSTMQQHQYKFSTDLTFYHTNQNRSVWYCSAPGTAASHIGLNGNGDSSGTRLFNRGSCKFDIWEYSNPISSQNEHTALKYFIK